MAKETLLANPKGDHKKCIIGIDEPTMGDHKGPHYDTENPKGDHKGPHSTPLLSRPYYDTEDFASSIK